jgi:hypothetical protein
LSQSDWLHYQQEVGFFNFIFSPYNSGLQAILQKLFCSFIAFYWNAMWNVCLVLGIQEDDSITDD